MRLSDAIALGALDSIPNPGYFTNLEGRRCAIGMAFHAIGIPDSKIITDPERAWEQLDRVVGKVYTTHINHAHPCGCSSRDHQLPSVITHLFDHHVFGKGDWTLNQLIEWVRSVEPTPPESSPTPTIEVATPSVAPAPAPVNEGDVVEVK